MTGAPLSDSQRLFWAGESDPDGVQELIRFSLELRGELDVSALERGLHRLVAIQPSLRTVFLTEADGSQVVLPAETWSLSLTPLPHEGDSVDEAISAVSSSSSARAVDLRNGPPFRVRLLRVGPEHHVLVVELHHIIADGVSVELFVDQMGAFYEAELGVREPPSLGQQPGGLPERIDLATSSDDEEAWQFWSSWLGSLEPGRSLTEAVGARSPDQVGWGCWHERRLGTPLSARLLELSAQQRVSPFTVLIVGFALLLHRYTEAEDVVIGTPVSLRRRASGDRIGCFINTVPLRIPLWGDPTVEELVRRVRQSTVESLKRSAYPFAKINGEWRRRTGGPLLDVIFGLQRSSFGVRSWSRLEVHVAQLPEPAGPYLLNVEMLQERRAFVAQWQYSPDSVAPGLVDRISQHFESCLEQLTDNPTREISSIDPVDDGQQVEAARPGAAESAGELVHLKIGRQLSENPDARFAHDPSLTYGELAAGAATTLDRLLAHGVGTGDKVGLVVGSAAGLATGILGVWAAGGVCVLADPDDPPLRLALSLAGVRHVLADREVMERLAEATSAPVEPLAQAVADDDPAERISDALRSVHVDVSWQDRPVVVVPVSGGQGVRQVEISGGTLSAAVHHAVRLLGADRRDCWATTHPAATVGLLRAVLGALVTGCSMRTGDIQKLLTDGHPATIVDLAATSEESVRDSIEQLTQGIAPRVTVLEGPVSLANELSGVSTEIEFARGFPEAGGWVAATSERGDQDGLVPFGRLRADVEASVQDGSGRSAPPGVVGELCLSVPAPGGGQRKFGTGYQVRQAEGRNLEVRGVNDGTAWREGRRVHPGEIGAAILEVSGVRQADVVMEPPVPPGEIYAFITGELGETSVRPEDAVRSGLDQRLPRYMHPSRIAMAALPRTPSGAFDPTALATAIARVSHKPMPEGDPRSLSEVVDVWREVLELPVGPDDDFFALGGHSLIALRIAASLTDLFGVEVGVRDIFESRTVRRLAEVLDEKGAEERSGARVTTQPDEAPSGVPSDLRGLLDGAADGEASPVGPLSLGQEELWLASQLTSDGTPYHLACGFTIRGALDVDRLLKALVSLVDRHEALRTAIIARQGYEPKQVVVPPGSEQVRFESLHGIGSGVDPELARLVDAEANRQFDIEGGRPFRATVVRVSADWHLLILAAHHLAVDGWSLDLLVNELSTLYEGQRALSDPTLRYVDYARWQRGWLATAQGTAEVDKWRTSIRDLVEDPALHKEEQLGRKLSWRGRELNCPLPGRLSLELDASARSGTSPFALGLAALAVLCHRHTNHSRIAIATPTSGRPFAALNDVVGLFTHVVPVFAEVSGRQRLEEIVEQIRVQVLELFDRQLVPPSRVYRDLGIGRTGRTELPVPTFFHWDPEPFSKPEFAGATTSYLRVDTPTSQFEKMVKLTRMEDGFLAGLRFRSDMMSERWADRFLQTYVRVLEEILTRPETTVEALSLISPDEQQRLLRGYGRAVDR